MKHAGIKWLGTAICVGWTFRVIGIGDTYYSFLIGNIFLAAVPLLVEQLLQKVKRHFKGFLAKITKIIASLVWLLFLPNAFYILTDFMHLNPDVLVDGRNDAYDFPIYYDRGDGLYLYDTLLVLAATIFGAYVGGLALFHAYLFFKKRMSRLFAGLALTSVMLLAAIGVYMGRFGRWNSWEGLHQPHKILMDLFDNLLTPQTRGRFLLVITTIFIFELASLMYIYTQQNRLPATKKPKNDQTRKVIQSEPDASR